MVSALALGQGEAYCLGSSALLLHSSSAASTCEVGMEGGRD